MNQKRKVRYAVIGAGNIAQVAVLPAFEHAQEACELAAIISGDPEKRAVLSERYGVDRAGGYEHLETILRDAHIDAAYIALPNHLHREYTERCAALGVHVLCEKPMAMNVEDCKAMIQATDAARVKLMIAYRLHFEETNLSAIQLARSGKLGDVRTFTSMFAHDVREGDIRTQPDVGGGALFDLGPYPVNACRNLFGAEPYEVCAFQSPVEREGDEVDVMTTAILRFPGDRFAQLTVNQGAADVSELRLVGTKGDLRLEPAYEYAQGLEMFVTIDGKTEHTKTGKRDQFAPQLIYFARCVLDDVEPEPSGLEGLADVRVLEAIAQSAERGEPVKLAPFDMTERPDMSQNINKPPVKPPEPVNAPSPSR